MLPSASSAPKHRFSVRRIALLSTALVGIGAAAFVLAPNMPSGTYPSALAQNLSEQAKTLNAPVGFADMVQPERPPPFRRGPPPREGWRFRHGTSKAPENLRRQPSA